MAELARLIDEDPFADFNSRRREPTAAPDPARVAEPLHEIERRHTPAFTEPPVEVEPDYAQPGRPAEPASDGGQYDAPGTYQEPEAYDAAAAPQQPAIVRQPAAYQQPAEPDVPPLDDLESESDYDRESTERLYAELAAASQRVEPGFDREPRQADPYEYPEAQAPEYQAPEYQAPEHQSPEYPAPEYQAPEPEAAPYSIPPSQARDPQYDTPAARNEQAWAAGDVSAQPFDAAAALGESLGVSEPAAQQQAAYPPSFEQPTGYEQAPAYEQTPVPDQAGMDAPDLRAAAYDQETYTDSEPYFDESGHVPPYDGEGEELESDGRRKGTFVVAGLLGLIVVGGAVALGYQTLFGDSSDGPPPVIRADSKPSKVEPSGDAATEGSGQQGKLVYDRVGDNSDANTRLVPREEPVGDVGGRQVRVISPGNGQADTGLRGSSTAGDATGQAADQLPKRVRTVVVKPDGTIVGEIEAPKPAQPIQPATLPGSEPAGTQPTAAAGNGASGNADSVPIPAPKPNELASTQSSPAQPAAPQPAAPQPVATPPAGTQSGTQPTANFVPPAAPAQPQTQGAGAPLSLNPETAASLPVTPSQPAPVTTQPATTTTAAAQPAAAPEATFPPGSYVVQVAASRSQQDAQSTAASITQRYGSALSGYQPAVERADLGDRGIYYRVGVGPLNSQGAANSLCDKLKSNGLDCFVRRN